MQSTEVHFIAGLPRAGSTLLAALLRQDPRISAGMTSPVGTLFNAMLTATSQRNESSIFIEEVQRERLLRGCFEAIYADVPPGSVIFDTNRQWTTKLPALARLYPRSRVVCCVRNLAWVLDSIEALIRRNAYDLSGIFNFDAQGTVYSRCEGLTKGDGMVGFAWNALREAIYGPQADRLVLLRYESLTANPRAALAALYRTLDLAPFDHDPDHIEPCYETVAFDAWLGTPGLHDVAGSVKAVPRSTILPPDLFSKHERDDFWNDPAQMPAGVTVI